MPSPHWSWPPDGWPALILMAVIAAAAFAVLVWTV